MTSYLSVLRKKMKSRIINKRPLTKKKKEKEKKKFGTNCSRGDTCNFDNLCKLSNLLLTLFTQHCI